MQQHTLDAVDWKILMELQQDARLTYTELGRRVGLSSPAVQERVHKLQDAGVIEGYHAKINPKKVGLPIIAFSRLVDVRGKQHILLIADIAQTLPEVISCYHVMGRDEYLLHIVATSVEHLETVLARFTDYCQSISSIVIRANIDNRPISPEITNFLVEDES